MTTVRFVTKPSQVKIRDTSRKGPRVDPDQIRQALGATIAGSSKGMDLFEVAETMRRMVDSANKKPS